MAKTTSKPHPAHRPEPKATPGHTHAAPGAAAVDEGITDAFAQARKAAEEFTRMFGEMNLPAAPGMDVLMRAHQRNLDAMTAANRIALEGAQTVARRNLEIMQKMMGEVTEAMQALATDAPQAKAARQAARAKEVYQHAVSHAEEMADLIRRSNAEAVQTLNARIAAAMDELRAMMTPRND